MAVGLGGDDFWQMKPMTDEERAAQLIKETFAEIPSTAVEMRKFLDIDNLNRLKLPLPASDFNIPSLHDDTVPNELITVDYTPEDPRMFVRFEDNGKIAAVSRNDVTLAEWLGLWATYLG